MFIVPYRYVPTSVPSTESRTAKRSNSITLNELCTASRRFAKHLFSEVHILMISYRFLLMLFIFYNSLVSLFVGLTLLHCFHSFHHIQGGPLRGGCTFAFIKRSLVMISCRSRRDFVVADRSEARDSLRVVASA